MSQVQAIVWAAGEGKRMKSTLPKVLHRIAGRPLVYYPVRAALDAGADHVIVVASPSNRAALDATLGVTFGSAVRVVEQLQPLGTADAVRAGLPAVSSARTLILYGDTPLLDASQLRSLLDALDADPKTRLVLMTCQLADPFGYGRVLRDPLGNVNCVREQRDLAASEQAIQEVNAGVYAAWTDALGTALRDVRPNNAQGEYYLTDVVEILARSSKVVAVLGDAQALVGINDRAQLADAEARMYRRIREHHGRSGVSIRGDAYIDETVQVESDVCIEAGVHLRGQSFVGAGTHIDVGCVVTDSTIGKDALIKPYSVITQSSVGDGAQIGPFAHLRPDSRIDEQARIGNFVETKKTHMRRGSKANHLSYLGDADIGEGANIGAGTIVCNYDGFVKHKTVVGARAFVGSDSQIVAPIEIGEGAYVATGTTVTIDVPADALAIGRTRQQNKQGYAVRLRERLARAVKGSM